jgi:hypothetical protein
MAEARHRNLREGLTELKERKEARLKRRAEILSERNAAREEALTKPDREDVRLTLPSVLKVLQGKAEVADPRREDRLAEKRANWVKKEERRRAERAALLHELYIDASEFIVTETQLDAVIEAKFSELSGPHEFLTRILPPTVTELLAQKSRTTGGVASGMTESGAVGEVGAALTGERC